MTSLARRIRRLFPMPTIHGYDDPRIAQRVAEKTRDYVPNPYIAIAGEARVLDFGGGCGVHYLEAMAQAIPTRWAIVETKAMVTAAHPTPNLHFFTDLNQAVDWLGGPPELILADGAIQYTPDPYQTAVRLAALRPQTIHYRRTPVHDGPAKPYLQHSYLSDHGPGPAYGSEAIVETWVIPLRRSLFLNAHWQYTLTEPSPGEFIFKRR